MSSSTLHKLILLSLLFLSGCVTTELVVESRSTLTGTDTSRWVQHEKIKTTAKNRSTRRETATLTFPGAYFGSPSDPEADLPYREVRITLKASAPRGLVRKALLKTDGQTKEVVDPGTDRVTIKDFQNLVIRPGDRRSVLALASDNRGNTAELKLQINAYEVDSIDWAAVAVGEPMEGITYWRSEARSLPGPVSGAPRSTRRSLLALEYQATKGQPAEVEIYDKNDSLVGCMRVPRATKTWLPGAPKFDPGTQCSPISTPPSGPLFWEDVYLVIRENPRLNNTTYFVYWANEGAP